MRYPQWRTSDYPYVGQRVTPRVTVSPHYGAGVLRSFGVSTTLCSKGAGFCLRGACYAANKYPRFGSYVIRCKSLPRHVRGRRCVGIVVGALLKAGAA